MYGQSFVSLLARTTGRRPWRDRITDLAAVRVVEGTIEATYRTSISYSGRRSGRHDEWGGLDDAEERPTFSAVAPLLRELVADYPLIGPDVSLHLAHVSYELSRLDQPGLHNPGLDLSTLADLAFESHFEGEKPTLARLAEQLGLPPHRPGDLAGETRLVARVALELARRLDPVRYPTLEAAIAARERPGPRPLLQPWRRSQLPAEPGVYVLRDDRERPLYVGKAGDLRTRVESYLGHAIASARHLDGLAEATAELDVHPTGSELEASLLEARLIRELRPRYNVQRQIQRPKLFVRVHLGEAWPRLGTSAEVRDDGAVYLGPFRSATAATRACRLAREMFELHDRRPRTADGREIRPDPDPLTEGERNYGSLHRSLREGDGVYGTRSPGAVQQGESHQAYRERLQQALLFLAGERQAAVDRLRTRMRRAAGLSDMAELGRVRELLRQAHAFSLQDAALSMSPHTDTFLAFDGRQAYLVHAARLVACVEAASFEAAQASLAPALASLDRSGPPQLDESAHLVLRWLASRGPGWKLVRV